MIDRSPAPDFEVGKTYRRHSPNPRDKHAGSDIAPPEDITYTLPGLGSVLYARSLSPAALKWIERSGPNPPCLRGP